jgi:molybdopterin-guanine dinucleotide biosynthesis protein A
MKRADGSNPATPAHGNSLSGLSNLTGVVLCGGESRRMGRDKGLLPIGDTCWAVFMAGKLAPWSIPVVYSINPRQEVTYGALIPSERLVIDEVGLQGPLEGLFSVHKQLPGRDLLLLACDMPDLDAPTIQGLIDAYGKEDGYDFYVYQEEVSGGREEASGQFFAQPFCGIYTSAGLALAGASRHGNGPGDLSLQSLLYKGKTKRLPLERIESFRNYNSF